MLEILTDAGASLAIPAQTIYTARDRGIDPERSQTAVDRVREWKRDFDPGEISKMQNRLPYPPPESVLRNGK